MLVGGVVSVSTWCVVLVAGNTFLLFSDCVVLVTGISVNVVSVPTFRVVLVGGVVTVSMSCNVGVAGNATLLFSDRCSSVGVVGVVSVSTWCHFVNVPCSVQLAPLLCGGACPPLGNR